MNELNNEQQVHSHDDLADWGSILNRPSASSTDSAEGSPVDIWIAKSPNIRQPEVEYLNSFNPELPISISEKGNLQKPFKVGPWIFLMELDKTFPKSTEENQVPIRVYLVIPNSDEIMKKFGLSSIPNVTKDRNGSDYLVFPEIEQELQEYISGQYSEELMVEKTVKHTNDWASTLAKQLKQRSASMKKQSSIFSFLFGSRSGGKSGTLVNGRSKYIDGRSSVTGELNKRCQKVVLSNRAYSQIFSETYSKIRTETGGLLLGHFDNGVWYVVEASDPGINATFTASYHEGDDAYENHVCGVLSRMYKHPLVFLGMWHRHPGSLDVFSGTDDQTNYKYAESAGNGCISALINIDPNFRVTFYYVEKGRYMGEVYYTKVDVEVGDDKFENSEILRLASSEDILRRIRNGGNNG